MIWYLLLAFTFGGMAGILLASLACMASRASEVEESDALREYYREWRAEREGQA